MYNNEEDDDDEIKKKGFFSANDQRTEVKQFLMSESQLHT